MYELKMMNGDIIEITESTARQLVGKSGVVVIPDVGIVNLASMVSVLPKGLAKTKDSANTMKLHDGSIAIKKFGKWVDRYSGAELDSIHYPELVANEDVKLIE